MDLSINYALIAHLKGPTMCSHSNHRLPLPPPSLKTLIVARPQISLSIVTVSVPSPDTRGYGSETPHVGDCVIE